MNRFDKLRPTRNSAPNQIHQSAFQQSETIALGRITFAQLLALPARCNLNFSIDILRSLEPEPKVLAQEITDDLQTAWKQFSAITSEFKE